MRLVFTIIFSLAATFLLAQNPNPRTAIILSGHTPVEFKEAVGTLNNADGIEVVRHQDPVISFKYATEELRIEAMQLLYTMDFRVTSKSGLPVDFPILAPNATEEQEQSYGQQKDEWIDSNPDRYQEVLEIMQQNSGVTVISQDEFDEMPEEKQEHILEHPELYSVE